MPQCLEGLEKSSNMKTGIDISVIIPTLNRACSLERSVRSLLNQNYSAERFEIIVVDNGSSDVTCQVIKELKDDFVESKLHYVVERKLGIHNARHAGVRAAKGRILVFTDDDTTTSSLWIQSYAEAFEANPNMVASGGPVRSVWEKEPPQWLLDYMGNFKNFYVFSLTENPSAEFRLSEEGTFVGCNMAIRRSVFDRAGFHPELFGSKMIGDGEAGLYRDIWGQKGLIGYVPNAVVFHHIPFERMKIDYLLLWASNLGKEHMFGRWWKKERTPGRLLKEFFLITGKYGKFWLKCVGVGRRLDQAAIDIKYQSSIGWGMLHYLWWMISDPQVQEYLDMKRFRP